MQKYVLNLFKSDKISRRKPRRSMVITKKLVVLVISLLIPIAISGALLTKTIIDENTGGDDGSKSAYQIYRETHPNYNKTEAEWLDDLINGRLEDKKTFNVTFNSVGGSEVEPQQVKDGSKAAKPDNPTKLGYTFKNWQYKGEEWMFNGYVVTEDVELVASWNINQYSITYDYDGGTPEGENPLIYNVNSNLDLDGGTRLGYSFAGWYNGETLMNSIKPGTTGDLALKAHWSADKHKLTVKSQDEARGQVSIVSGVGHTDEQITVKATSVSPYVFKSWVDENGKTVSLENPYTFSMPANDYTLKAEFAELRKLTLTIDDEDNGEVSGAGDHIIGSNVTIKCTHDDKHTFKGWYNSKDELVSTFEEYTFVMPGENYALKAVFMNESEAAKNEWDIAHGVVPKLSADGKTLTYGMYPQQVVDDATLEKNLFEKAELDSVSGYYVYEGEYYAKLNAKPFDFSGYVGEDAIYEENFDNGKEIIKGNTYWYAVKPITWIIMKQEGSNYTLISETLLDTKNYNDVEYERLVDDKKVYPNNYEYSSTRTWLNGEFFNSMFFLSSENVLETEVDNSMASTLHNYNAYSCNNTFDKVFLPSRQEINEYFAANERLAYTTDYVRSKAVYYEIEEDYLYCCDYWTRSPAAGAAKEAYRVHSNGYINSCGVRVGSYCIRPCISISLI